MGKAKIQWSREKLAEMANWQRVHSATTKETAEHFKIAPAAYYAAKTYQARQKRAKQSAPAKRRSVAFTDIIVPDKMATPGKVFLAIGSPEQIAEVIKSWQ